MKLMFESDVSDYPPSQAQTFILGGIQAARAVKLESQSNVLTDIAMVMGCEIEALQFLISDRQDASEGVIDFPDASRWQADFDGDICLAAE